MRIGELAKHGGCDVETVRFYEREGLLDRPERKANGYRDYSETHQVQLNFIRHCRSLGMGLPDVRTLRTFQANPHLACDDINQMIDDQIQRIHHQVESLRMLENQLLTLRHSCPADTKPGACGILKNLVQAAKGEECSCHKVT